MLPVGTQGDDLASPHLTPFFLKSLFSHFLIPLVFFFWYHISWIFSPVFLHLGCPPGVVMGMCHNDVTPCFSRSMQRGDFSTEAPPIFYHLPILPFSYPIPPVSPYPILPVLFLSHSASFLPPLSLSLCPCPLVPLCPPFLEAVPKSAPPPHTQSLVASMSVCE